MLLSVAAMMEQNIQYSSSPSPSPSIHLSNLIFIIYYFSGHFTLHYYFNSLKKITGSLYGTYFNFLPSFVKEIFHLREDIKNCKKSENGIIYTIEKNEIWVSLRL